MFYCSKSSFTSNYFRWEALDFFCLQAAISGLLLLETFFMAERCSLCFAISSLAHFPHSQLEKVLIFQNYNLRSCSFFHAQLEKVFIFHPSRRVLTFWMFRFYFNFALVKIFLPIVTICVIFIDHFFGFIVAH